MISKPYFNKVHISVVAFFIALSSQLSLANEGTQVEAIEIKPDLNSLDFEEDKDFEENKKIAQEVERLNKFEEADTVINSATKELNKEVNDRMSKEQTLEYLSAHPQELELLLAKAVRVGRNDIIADLLPIYKVYPRRDPSLVIWSQAILDQHLGNMEQSIKALKQLNSEFPEVNTLKFQLAVALFKNRQFNEALSKLRGMQNEENISQQDLAVVTDLIDLINERSKWSFYINGSYVNDDNINNTPPEGTYYGNGVVAGPRVSGEGLEYIVSADKKWYHDNQFFNSLGLASYGTYYWDNIGYSDVSGRLSVGIGYDDAIKSIELSPNYTKQFYGLGEDDADKLYDYRDSYGVDIDTSYKLNKEWTYSNTIGYVENKYTEEYEVNNGNDIKIRNRLNYRASPTIYLSYGLNYFKRNTERDYNSFDVKDINVSMVKVWDKGFLTRTNLGYARKQYHGYDFFGDKRQNDEYSAGLSVWNENIKAFDLMPRLNWNYRKVDSNSVREELESNEVTIDLTKIF